MASKLSPMMRQYLDIKEQYSDEILFFRLGDFYEMFFEDAKTASRELELTLTGKNCGLEERAPMCGVPFHSADTYIARLIEKGYRVAICEQTEDPSEAKGIVKREVVQIVTPGTVISGEMLREDENNYLASIYFKDSAIGLAYCDISTGQLCLTSLLGSDEDDIFETLVNELVRIKAKEVLADGSFAEAFDEERIASISGAYIHRIGDEFYRHDAGMDRIRAQFNVDSTEGLGIEEGSAAQISLAALLLYISDTQKTDLSYMCHRHIHHVRPHGSGQGDDQKSRDHGDPLRRREKGLSARCS